MPISTPPRHQPRGFSLVELLIVIGIIVLLLAILLPVVSNVRKSSRSAACMANLQQWGYSFQLYLAENRGQTMPLMNGNDPNHYEWWTALAPYNAKGSATLFCPEAIEHPVSRASLHNAVKGSAHHAWDAYPSRGETFGSYGVNYWIYSTQRHTGQFAPLFIRFPVRLAGRVPLLGDCDVCRALALSGDPIPTNLESPSPPHTGDHGITEYCMDRHRMAINMVFLDGHAEHLPLAELWKLKWSETFKPRDVVIPGS